MQTVACERPNKASWCKCAASSCQVGAPRPAAEACKGGAPAGIGAQPMRPAAVLPLTIPITTPSSARPGWEAAATATSAAAKSAATQGAVRAALRVIGVLHRRWQCWSAKEGCRGSVEGHRGGLEQSRQGACLASLSYHMGCRWPNGSAKLPSGSAGSSALNDTLCSQLTGVASARVWRAIARS